MKLKLGIFATSMALAACYFRSPHNIKEHTTKPSTSQPITQTASTPPVNSPNFIFILADDMTLRDLQYMQYTKALVADQGINFANYFISTSLCCPSRTTTVRGQFAHNHGIQSNVGSFNEYRARGLGRTTLGPWLKARGYATALYGKYINAYPENGTSEPGWDEFNVSVGRKAEGLDKTIDRSQEFINSAVSRSTPFFLYLSPKIPHTPARPAQRHKNLMPDLLAPRDPNYDEAEIGDKPSYISNLNPLSKREIRRIDKLFRKRILSLQAVDEMVRDLINMVDSLGALDNTYIIFTSDNGFMQGQHRLPFGKQVPYEESIRVPLVMRGPGILPGRTSRVLTTNVDLCATFLDLAGALPTYDLDGRSLLDILYGKLGPEDIWPRKAVLLEQWNPTGDDPEGDRIEVPDFAGLRFHDGKFVEYKSGEREFYNLLFDPYELNNLAGQMPPAVLDQFSAYLSNLKNCKGVGCRQADSLPLPAF